MKANDSAECRNCHSWEAMDWHAQSLVAQREQVGEVEGFQDSKLVSNYSGL
jgi:nitrate/TMAO reductase-like tetraheme cytochrome c subunit